MIVASSGASFTALAETGLPNLVGVIAVRIVDPSNNVFTAPTTAGIIALTDGGGDTGDYIAALIAPTVTGTTEYVVEWSTDGTFDPETVLSENLSVVVGVIVPVLPPIPSPPGFGPQVGPCTAWVSAEEVAACCNVTVGTDLSVFDDSIGEACQLLFELSGRQFNGLCGQTVRPCNDVGCGGWQGLTWPASPGVPQIPWGQTWGYWGSFGWGWGWPGGTLGCSCSPLSRVALPGYPVTSITQVLIDGVVLPETDPDTGLLNWRLDEWRWLTRMAGMNGQAAFWPSCQDLDRELDQPGTFAVTYTFGQAPPLLGILAARRLACELYKLCNGEECSIPLAGVTRITRQGVTIERAPFVSWAQQNGRWATGIAEVDMFLSAYNRAGLLRRATIWSPDIAPFAERVGGGTGS